MKLNWVGLRYRFPLVIHPTSSWIYISEIYIERRKGRSQWKRKKYIMTDIPLHTLWNMTLEIYVWRSNMKMKSNKS